ncbi:MAG: hypothetical protein MRY78_04840 [Saprospiraceae bacterium]|nr:hypothetical protein [Saprospiraceae bacterium]
MANQKNPFQPLLDKIPVPFRNRYFVALVLFVAWMVFFDKHDMLTQWRLQNSVEKLEEDKVYYSKKIKEAQQERLDLDVNKEKFAREKYYMQKQNEDVFIIVKDEDKEEE